MAEKDELARKRRKVRVERVFSLESPPLTLSVLSLQMALARLRGEPYVE